MFTYISNIYVFIQDFIKDFIQEYNNLPPDDISDLPLYYS